MTAGNEIIYDNVLDPRYLCFINNQNFKVLYDRMHKVALAPAELPDGAGWNYFPLPYGVEVLKKVSMRLGNRQMKWTTNDTTEDLDIDKDIILVVDGDVGVHGEAGECAIDLSYRVSYVDV